MRKFFSAVVALLVATALLAMPAYASEVTAEATEEVTPTVTEEATENATEGNVEATEAATEEETTEEVTEAPTEEVTEEETETEPVGIVEGLPAEADRDWLINAIKTAKPDEVEFIKGYIEDALVAMEGKNYTGWEWAYKIVEDNAEWLACLVVGLGFIAAAVVAIVKYRREKILINNSVEAVNIAEKKMEELTAKTDKYEKTVGDVVVAVGAMLEYLKERDDALEAQAKDLQARDDQVIASNQNAINAKILLADVLGELIQLSNIPQIRKDEIYSKHETAKNHILNEMMGGGDRDESEV